MSKHNVILLQLSLLQNYQDWYIFSHEFLSTAFHPCMQRAWLDCRIWGSLCRILLFVQGKFSDKLARACGMYTPDRQTLYVMSLRHCFFLLSCFHSFPKRCSSHSIFITRLPTPGVAFALALLTQQVLGGIVPDMLSLVSAIGKLPPQMGLWPVSNGHAQQ